MNATLLLFLVVSFFLNFAPAQETTDLLPETQGAKALLEDLMARRYRQELSTIIDSAQFSLGARLELTRIETVEPKSKSEEEEPAEVPVIHDLMLGTIDPEALLEKYSSPDQAKVTKQLLDNYRIKNVTISVGLKEGLPKDTKTNIEKWLKERVSKEFGKNGTGQVSMTIQQSPSEIKLPEKQPIDLLNQFQTLAGQLVLAVALLLGIILWRLMGGGKSASTSQQSGPTINMSNSATGVGPSGNAARSEAEMVVHHQKNERERQSALESIADTTLKITAILPHLAPNFEAVVRSWCQMGDLGRFRLAVFAEAVGKDVGRLPIPIDALTEVGKVFSRVLELSPQEKLSYLQKAYWDLLSVMNLGPEVLNQPFAYIGGLNTNAVSQMLVDENPKLKALVSLYMPIEMRTRYFKGLDGKAKLELLQQASQMDSVPADELKAIDSNIKSRVQPKASKEVVILDRALLRMIEALRPQEELSLLSSLQGPAIESFKRTNPSIAFLEQWPDDKLKIFMTKVAVDELLPYIRLRPGSKNRLISLLPPMTAEMINEEFERPDRTSAEDKDQWLAALKNRMLQMFELKELVLDDIFPLEKERQNVPAKAS